MTTNGCASARILSHNRTARQRPEKRPLLELVRKIIQGRQHIRHAARRELVEDGGDGGCVRPGPVRGVQHRRQLGGKRSLQPIEPGAD